MSNGKKGLSVLLDSIMKYFQDESQKLPYDKTVQGIVTEVIGTNKYKVEIQGTVYTVPCCTEQQFKVNDNVLVKIVQNDYKRKYIYGRG